MEKTWRLLTNIIAAVLMGLVTACGGEGGTGTVPPSLSPSLPADPATPGQSSWERHQEDGGRYFDQGMDCVDAENETCALEAFENAIAEYSKAIELNHGAIKSYYNRGQAHQERGDIYFDLGMDEAATDAYDKAKDDFSQVIDQQPDDRNMLTDALYNRGMLYYQDASFAEAIADFDKAIELAPEDSELYLQRGDIYAEMGKTDLAIADFSKAIESMPDNPEAYYLRARAYEDKGENTLALADFEKVLELEKEGVEVPVEVKKFVQKRVEELSQSVEKP